MKAIQNYVVNPLCLISYVKDTCCLKNESNSKHPFQSMGILVPMSKIHVV